MKLIGKLAFCLVAASIAAPTFAYASPWQDHHDDRRDDHRDDHRNDRHDDHRNDHHGGYSDHRGPQHNGHWGRGQRYTGQRIFVTDYRSRHLREPPRGYRWVREDNNTNEVLLIAIATGVIADIVSQ